MSVQANRLINAKYAADADTVEYTVPGSTRVIIDKATATNTDSGAQTISVNLIPSGGSVGGSNLIIKDKSISAGATLDMEDLKNQILNAGDRISVKASVASKVVIRFSGRVIT